MGNRISFEHDTPVYGGYHQDRGRAKYFGLLALVAGLIALIGGLIAKEITTFIAIVAIAAIYATVKALIHYNGMEITKARTGLLFLGMCITFIIFSFLADSDVLMFIGFGGIAYLVLNEIAARKLHRRVEEGENATLGGRMLNEAAQITAARPVTKVRWLGGKRIAETGGEWGPVSQGTVRAFPGDGPKGR